MKKIFALVIGLSAPLLGIAQDYPNPEFSNEVSYLRKGPTYTVTRLEKNASKMNTKTKPMGGTEQSYSIDEAKSPVRISNSDNISFVFWNGTTTSANASQTSNPARDSVMKANGMTPSVMQQMNNVMNPMNTLTLYKVEIEGSERKIILQKTPGALPFGKKKVQSSDKFTFSVKQIRDGYWELVIDKHLSPGEYAFTMMNVMNPGSAMDGSITIFAFGID